MSFRRCGDGMADCAHFGYDSTSCSSSRIWEYHIVHFFFFASSVHRQVRGPSERVRGHDGFLKRKC